jgi:hypothetical protein
MFRENNDHLQQNLFDSMSTMNQRSKKLLLNSWAKLFYEDVFCQIDETPFKTLYCQDNGRPNFPVNILLSLEFIKHFKNYTDEEILEQFHFNYQVMYAVGIRNLGELPLAPRTLYEFRERIYSYVASNPDETDLIFDQFEQLTQHFLAKANLTADEQRVDSTQIMPNIKRAGRLSLGYDVLRQAVSDCPQEILPDRIQDVLKPDFKTELLYRTRTGDATSRLQELLNICAELLSIAADHPGLERLDSIMLAERFLTDQAKLDPQSGSWIVKENKEINARCLQSAYDPDATFRKKGGNKHVGYVLNLSETCNEENPVQMITDYTLEPNSAGDSRMLRERLSDIKEQHPELNDVYVDGAYYSDELEELAQELKIKIRYTNMTGKASSKIPLTDFNIEITDESATVCCPGGQDAVPCYVNKKTQAITAHFDLEKCAQCPARLACPAKPMKNSAVLRITKKARLAANVRKELSDDKKRLESTSKRAAIEGTNSVLKRAQGADKLRVRTLLKSKVVIGFKVIGYNLRQLIRYTRNDFRRGYKPNKPESEPQGVSLPIFAAS